MFQKLMKYTIQQPVGYAHRSWAYGGGGGVGGARGGAGEAGAGHVTCLVQPAIRPHPPQGKSPPASKRVTARPTATDLMAGGRRRRLRFHHCQSSVLSAPRSFWLQSQAIAWRSHPHGASGVGFRRGSRFIECQQDEDKNGQLPAEQEVPHPGEAVAAAPQAMSHSIAKQKMKLVGDRGSCVAC